MIFPVYRTELAIPQPESFLSTSYFSESELKRFYGAAKIAGHIAVGSEVWSAAETYELGDVPPEPPIERVYDLLTENIRVDTTTAAHREKEGMPEYDELPFELRARGEFNGIDVSIAGLYYQSNKHVGWMNIRPRASLFKTISQEQQRKMLGL